jgi:L-lactate dehydrogenase (cytochrome)
MKSAGSLNGCLSVLDMRNCARRRLPAPIFNILDGAAETETTAHRNTDAFDDVKLIPRCLAGVEHVNTSIQIFGRDIQWPLYCSPTGGSRFFHPEGELAVARAAAKAGTLYGLSTVSTSSIEAVAAASDGPKLFQLYICKDRDFTRTLIERAKRAGYVALCVTVDTPVPGKCEQDVRAGLFNPWHEWPLRTALSFARHPLWMFNRLGTSTRSLANFADSEGNPPPPGFFANQLDPAITWRDIREVADSWRGPLAVKGIMSADDARRAANAGASAVIVSNHGGRQLDGAAASIEVLPSIARAVGGQVEVIFDGGIRRGVHILKALSCGAKACSIGRPYLYGLAAGGEAGVAKVLQILRTELELAMRLSGCPNLASIDENLVWKH